MPGKLRRLSGAEVVKIFEALGFEGISQRGDHIKLRRIKDGAKQTLVVPLHRELDKGTLQVIYRQALAYIDESSLRPRFYSD